MPPLHDPKRLSETVELDYFKRPRRRLRAYLNWGALALAMLGLGLTFVPGKQSAYEAGPVSTAHAFLNNDCSSCHKTVFVPLRRFTSLGLDVHSVSDEACTHCHAGPDHHPPEARSDGCAACHREHRGRTVLAHVSDQTCTDCHADLRRVKPVTEYRDVGSFVDNHPDFAPRRDTGTIRFNHAKHLKLPAAGLHGIDVPLEQLRRQRCGYCHEIDRAGRYMLPVTYSKHCQSCHALSAPLGVAVPHPQSGEGPTMVRAVLRDRYLVRAEEKPEFTSSSQHSAEELDVFPGRPLPRTTRDQLTWADNRVALAERLLFDAADGCRRCHEEKNRDAAGLPNYGQPFVPGRWFEHSKFSHHAHRSLDCLQCHPQAVTSTESQDALMPKIAECRQCHRPQPGARTDCFECHSFHSHGEIGAGRKLSIGDLVR